MKSHQFSMRLPREVWKESERERKRGPFHPQIGVFITFLWMAHYPTLSLKLSLFNIPTLYLSSILKQTTQAMAKTLKEEVKWPSNQELDAHTCSFIQNDGFSDAVCVVDGSEIQNSRPIQPEVQQATWSVKKH